MLDRLIVFLVLGFLVFSPSIPDWSPETTENWYGVLGFWLGVIFLALISNLSGLSGRTTGD